MMNSRIPLVGFLTGLALLAGGGCEKPDQMPRRQMMVMLVDLTESFEDHLRPSFETLADPILPKGLRPGDTLLVIGIDDNSYEDHNVIYGPRRTDPSLLVFAQQLPKIREEITQIGQQIEPRPSRGTDIDGALHLAADHLPGNRECWLNLLIFSDMQQQQISDEIDLAAPPQLPNQARVTCLFVPRRKGENEYTERKRFWRAKFSDYGLPSDTTIEFLPPNSSTSANLDEMTVREMTRRPKTEAPHTASYADGTPRGH